MTKDGTPVAYAYDFPTQGLGRTRESSFQGLLYAWVDAWGDRMPRMLRFDIQDHLFRRDNLGLSLCFAGPQRADLLRQLGEWLRQQSAAVQAEAQPGLDEIVRFAGHTDSTRWNALPEILRTPVSVPTHEEEMSQMQYGLFAAPVIGRQEHLLCEEPQR